MTLSQSLVEVRNITSDLPRSNFDEQKIEKAARLIIEAEGIINPIIVNRTGINSFKVVNDHFEYYAAVRARELDLAIAETIAAYITEPENETIAKQVEIFRSDKVDSVNLPTGDTAIVQTRLNNLESRIENRLNELKAEYTQNQQQLEQKIEFLNQRLPEQIEPLTTFNEASVVELSSKLRLILSSNKANEIAQKIVKARPFTSLTQVIDKTKGLGEKSMLKIVDRWLYS